MRAYARMVTENRRDARFPARIVARMKRRNQTLELLTNDVSFRGVFIRTDAPPALRQLVRVELLLPEKVIVSGHAMVVHVRARADGLAKGEGAIPGIGLQFWGPIDRVREWEQFIHGLKQKEKAGVAAAKAADKVRRASERFKLAIEVVFDGERRMTRDISENGMAIRTEVAMPIGARTEVRFRAGDQDMKLDAVVRRRIDEAGFKGLGIELVDVSPEARAEFIKFVRANAPSEERIFIPPGDPKLH
jgi:hypothetical protein